MLSSVVVSGAESAHAQPSPPTIQYEMTLEGLPAHPKATTLKLESWSWGAVMAEASGEPAAARAEGKQADSGDPSKRKQPELVLSNQDFHFVIMQGPISAMLLEAMIAKKSLTRVSVRFKHPASDKKLELVMKDVRVSSYQTGGSSYGGEGPMDQLSLSFEKAKMTVIGKGAKASANVDSGPN